MTGCAVAQGLNDRVQATAAEGSDVIVAAWTGNGEEKVMVRIPAACVSALSLAANDTTSLNEQLNFTTNALQCRAVIQAYQAEGILLIEDPEAEAPLT